MRINAFFITAEEWFNASIEQRAEWLDAGAVMTNEELYRYAQMRYEAGQISDDDMAEAVAQYSENLT